MFTKKGFTLIELLIAMAILAILSTIGFGSFQSARIKAADSKRKSDLSTIAKSLEAYVNDHRAYPVSSSGLIVCKNNPTPTTCDWGNPFQDDAGTVYANALPRESGGGNYQYVSDGTTYTLYAHLENGEDPSIVTLTPAVTCGSASIFCNYKLTSSNQTP